MKHWYVVNCVIISKNTPLVIHETGENEVDISKECID